MLAACAEAEPGEEALVALGRDSQARWPAFAAELEAGIRDRRGAAARGHAGGRADRRRSGATAPSPRVPAAARAAAQWISAAETRRREPHLAGKLAGAVFSPEDHQVDNRKLAAGAAHRRRSGRRRRSASTRAVERDFISGGRVDGVVLADGSKVAADMVVLAAGAWSRSIGGLVAELRPPVRPIKGQMLALQHGSGGAAAQPRAVGARRLSGAAPRRPSDGRRDRRGEGLRHDAHRRRRADAAGSRLARGAGDRGTADRRDVGRPSARQPRRCADSRCRADRRAWSMPPAIIATAFC